MTAPGPAMSVILVAETDNAVQDVLAAFRAQTVREQLEIVLVKPRAAGAAPPPGAGDGFHSVTVVEVDDFHPLWGPRARGVHAARAPVVLLGESHAFPDPGHCQALLHAHRGPWAVVGPGFDNANPATLRSWIGLYMDYGPWVRPDRGRSVDHLPGHNSSYKRAVLLDYGERLEAMLVSSLRRHADLQARGHQLYLEPAARLFHLNVSRPGPWLEERLAAGRVFAAARSRNWGVPRRLLYAAAWPLIPAVRLGRVLRDMRRAQTAGFILRSLPLLAVGLGLSGLGEGLGYALGAGRATRRVIEMELHKDRYVRPADHPRATGLTPRTTAGGADR